MPPHRHRRRLINYLINPRFQSLLFLPYLMVLLALAAALKFTLYRTMVSFAIVNLDQGSDAVMTLADVYRITSLVGGGVFVLAGLLAYGLIIVLSHRVFGPIYAIHRHVRALNAGEFHQRIHLRRRDHLQTLAADLNTLTETLERRR